MVSHLGFLTLVASVQHNAPVRDEMQGYSRGTDATARQKHGRLTNEVTETSGNCALWRQIIKLVLVISWVQHVIVFLHKYPSYSLIGGIRVNMKVLFEIRKFYYRRACQFVF